MSRISKAQTRDLEQDRSYYVGQRERRQTGAKGVIIRYQVWDILAGRIHNRDFKVIR